MIATSRFLAMVSMLAASSAHTQAADTFVGTFTGTVVDACGRPAAGADVRISSVYPDGGEWVVQSDDAGGFRIDDVVPGEYRLTVRLYLHADVTYEWFQVNGMRTVTKNIHMMSGTGTLPWSSSHPYYVHEVLSKEELDRIPAPRSATSTGTATKTSPCSPAPANTTQRSTGRDQTALGGIRRSSWTKERLAALSIEQLRRMYEGYGLGDPAGLGRGALQRAILEPGDPAGD